MKRLSMLFWSGIWNMSEYLDIGLGKYAPFVFEKMLGLNRGDRIE